MKRVHDDWWPDRDQSCHRVCYDFGGAEIAIDLCKKHELVIQAGGNVGVWPRFLRETFSNVWTFEPSRENYELMLRNLSGVDVRAWNAALGDRRGKCSMRMNPYNCGDDQTVPGEEIEVIAIDDLEVSPDLIYLDVQGDELAVIKGALQTIQRCKPVIAIEHDEKFCNLKGDPDPVLRAMGYVHVDNYGQDRIYAEPGAKERIRYRHLRRFKTKGAALAACRKAPEGIEVDISRMTWRHKNGSKTHFIVGD